MLVLFLISGITRLVFALMIRPMDDWLWMLGSGLVAIVCALVLFANLPEAAAWLLGFLLGLELSRSAGRRGSWPGASARRSDRSEPGYRRRQRGGGGGRE